MDYASTTTQDIDPFKEGMNVKTDTASCPSCGAKLTFNPENQTLRCDHCGTELNFESTSNSERRFSELLSNNTEWASETKVMSCSNCGAKQVIPKKEISTECSFCGAPNVVEASEMSGLKPNAIVPFELNEESGLNRAIAWAKKHFFAPRRFKKELSAKDFKGVYQPAFTFDTQTTSVYKGRLGEYYYVTVKRGKNTVRERRTRYFSISGTYSKFYDDILISASNTIQNKNFDKIKPFNTSTSKGYASEFLFGFAASQYTKSGTECWNEAKDVIYNDTKKGILAKYTYDVVDSITIKTDCQNITYKYLLLPVYVGHFPYNKKNYNFYVNGVNGRASGSAPVSALKVLGLIGIITVAVAAIAILAFVFG